MFIVPFFVALLSFVNVYGLRMSSRLLMMNNPKYLGKDPIFIAGGSSGVGLELIKRLSSRGTPVQVLVRRPDAADYLSTLPGVKVFMGDALEADKVQGAMKGCVAAVTTLGGEPVPGQTERVDYAGNSNVIEQAGILGVERIVLVTSVGCGDTIGAVPSHVYKALEGALNAKSKAERELKMYTNLDWTIIRPGGLRNSAPTGKAVFTEDIMATGSVSREDVAELLVKVLGHSGQCTRRELTVVDPNFNPDYRYVPFNF